MQETSVVSWTESSIIKSIENMAKINLKRIIISSIISEDGDYVFFKLEDYKMKMSLPNDFLF